jgi:hypothetical protein
MRGDVRTALAITRSSTMEDRTLDITTTGRHRHGPDSLWGVAVLDEWVETSPLARVRFTEGDLRPLSRARLGVAYALAWNVRLRIYSRIHDRTCD